MISNAISLMPLSFFPHRLRCAMPPLAKYCFSLRFSLMLSPPLSPPLLTPPPYAIRRYRCHCRRHAERHAALRRAATPCRRCRLCFFHFRGAACRQRRCLPNAFMTDNVVILRWPLSRCHAAAPPPFIIYCWRCLTPLAITQQRMASCHKNAFIRHVRQRLSRRAARRRHYAVIRRIAMPPLLSLLRYCWLADAPPPAGFSSAASPLSPAGYFHADGYAIMPPFDCRRLDAFLSAPPPRHFRCFHAAGCLLRISVAGRLAASLPLRHFRH